MHKSTLVLGLLLSLKIFAAPQEAQMNALFASLKSSPDKLAHFLKAMPKGADLHNHLSGAVYAEDLLLYAKNDDFCINRTTFTVFSDTACEPRDRLNNAVQDPVFYNKLIDAWSIRNFQPVLETAPDHFFSAFGKYNAIVKKHQDQLLARVVKQAARDHESWLELMITADGSQAGLLGKEVGWDQDFETMRKKLLAHPKFSPIIQSATTLLDQMEAGKNAILDCNREKKDAGCKIKIRYLQQVAREQAPEMAFAQMLAGFEIARQDSRVAGLNLVQPEHGKISLRDYSLQMQMMAFLHRLYPEIAFSLHAGELNEAIASPRDLSFHIDEAVHVASAQRIGHGVDLFYESNADKLLKTMAENQIPVEVNLSSNAFILGAKGGNHPLPLYLNAGVPVTLSTDDQGINRSNLSKEYQIAAEDFVLDYSTLKNFARNSLSYSFAKGEKLWLENTYQHIRSECAEDKPEDKILTPGCTAFLKLNEKAALQWELEQQFAKFERSVLSAQGQTPYLQFNAIQ